VETILLLTGEGKLIPDVHPVTILAIDALTSDLNLNHGDKLVSRVIKPASIYIISGLVYFRKSDLKVGAVGKITIS